jgi:hypothetical protein
MPIMINDSSRYSAAAAGRALSLAIRAEALSDEIGTLHRDIRAARDEPVHRAGFRCDTAAGLLRQASTELQDTADHLDRIAGTLKPGACPIPWGVCPEMATPWPARAAMPGAVLRAATGHGTTTASACCTARQCCDHPQR